MAELGTLSNKELRKKCIEFGLPNVPVTDSSRKILIRRLEAVMSGKPIATMPPKGNRRETMHVSKPSEVASSPKIASSRSNAIKKDTTDTRPSRRTIAVGERHVTTTTTVSEPEYSDVSPDRVDPEPIKARTRTPEKLPSLYPKLPLKEPSPKSQALSKTGVVTTSYIQETTSLNKAYVAPEDEIVLAEEDCTVVGEPVEKTTGIAPKYSYVPLSESKVSTTAPVSSTISSSTRYSSLDYSYNKPSTLATTNLRKSYVAPLTYSNKRPLSSQYSSEEESEEDEDVVLVEESPIKDAETPFLSQFARNLENLKATPIRYSVGPTKITPPKSKLRNRDNVYTRRTIGVSSVNINPRRTINTAHNEIDYSSLRQIMLAIDEKYHLKHTLVLISIFIVAVFIYVFFIQSV